MKADKVELFMNIATVLSSGSSCPKRKVGCILLDKNYIIIGTGYNGVAKNLPHCTASFENGEPKCRAIHAEQNALMNCKDKFAIKYCFTTLSPCDTCAKMLKNTNLEKLYYLHAYNIEYLEYLSGTIDCIKLESRATKTLEELVKQIHIWRTENETNNFRLTKVR